MQKGVALRESGIFPHAMFAQKGKELQFGRSRKTPHHQLSTVFLEWVPGCSQPKERVSDVHEKTSAEGKEEVRIFERKHTVRLLVLYGFCVFAFLFGIFIAYWVLPFLVPRQDHVCYESVVCCKVFMLIAVACLFRSTTHREHFITVAHQTFG